jgi:hypothetical protein
MPEPAVVAGRRGSLDRRAMETEEFLTTNRTVIVDEAATAIERSGMRRYGGAGGAAVRGRLDALFARLLHSVQDRDLRPMAQYAGQIAEERFDGGYDISEVQRAFNALEESVWARALADRGDAHLATTLAVVSAALGAGKDALARRYVSLATEAHVPAVDVDALFAGPTS